MKYFIKNPGCPEHLGISPKKWLANTERGTDELQCICMIKKKNLFIIVAIICVGFGIGIYLQDLKHRESTTTYWEANRHNVQRFKAIEKFNLQMNAGNWRAMQDSISKQLDTLIILRFRKEMDSLDKLRKKP